MGVGPAVYLLMISGRMICIGIMGIANRASVSFFIPASINFKPVMESAAANPICSGKIANLILIKIGGKSKFHNENKIEGFFMSDI